MAEISTPMLGTFLAIPNVPQRKGKRNIERFPLAISSKQYQYKYEKKSALKEEEKIKIKRKEKGKRKK